MELPEIHFEHNGIEVIANGDGTGILVINNITGDELDWGQVSPLEQRAIKGKVKEWADHYQVMENE